jgi:4-amino-4-deoxy-L-arabinose transferase-like glycosyltransferase
MHASSGSSLKLISLFIGLAVFCFCGWLIFRRLDAAPIYIYDEARYANNAIDMQESPNLLVAKFQGKTDHYNTKPPLAIWLQAICMKLIGIREKAVRFPSAIAALATVFLLLYFCFRSLKSVMPGVVAALVMVSSYGYMLEHCARSGDLDSLLVCFLTFYTLVFFALLIERPERPRLYYACIAIGILAAVLTKGVAGLFMVPWLFLISLWPNNRFVYRQKQLYFTVGFSAACILGYYFLREANTPGYLQEVYDSELSRIGSEVMSWHLHPFEFYYENMLDKRFDFFLPVLPFTLLTFWFGRKNKTLIRLYGWTLTAALGYFLLISFPPVKLEWYDEPLYPMFGLLTGFFVFSVYGWVNEKIKQPAWTTVFFAALIPVVCLFPVKKIYDYQEAPVELIFDKEIDGAFLRHIQQSKSEIKSLTILKKEETSAHFDQLLFYTRAYQKKGLQTTVRADLDSLPVGTILLTSQQPFKDSLEVHYHTELLEQWYQGNMYRIGVRK